VLPESWETVVEEAERIIPLLEDDEQKAWEKRVRTNDPQLSVMISRFWSEADPRLSTPWNERLIEHWQRIAYARKHFRKNRSGTYDCDDRGTIYVKYGEPDRKQRGIFGTSAAFWMGSFWEEFKEMEESGLLDDAFSQTYEVWAYDNIGTPLASIFLFSREYGDASFGLVSGVESLIPRFGNDDRHLFYQILYYDELRFFDPFFDSRYSYLERSWETGSHTKDIRFMTDKVRDKINPTYKYADSYQSEFENLYNLIEFEPYTVRLLDNQNHPRIVLITSPKLAFNRELLQHWYGREFNIPRFQLSQTIMMKTHDLELIDKKADKFSSMFNLHHGPELSIITLGAEAVSGDNKLLALGKASLTLPEPLDQDLERLELSDLVLGVPLQQDSSITHNPIPVSPRLIFSNQDVLEMYIELYHLFLDENGNGHAVIEYGATLIKAKRGFFGFLKKKPKEKISSFSDLYTESRTDKMLLNFDISNLGRGEYEFFVKVKDSISGQEKTRKKMFTIVEPGKR